MEITQITSPTGPITTSVRKLAICKYYSQNSEISVAQDLTNLAEGGMSKILHGEF